MWKLKTFINPRSGKTLIKSLLNEFHRWLNLLSYKIKSFIVATQRYTV